MRRISIFLLVFELICMLQAGPAAALEKWDAAREVARLLSEAPALSAFPGTAGVVWKNSGRYSLTPDGGRLRDGICLLLLGDGNAWKEAGSRKFPYPKGGGAVLEITEASWYDALSGERLGELPVREYGENGIRGIEVLFPAEAGGHVAAITTSETVSGDYRLDDVIELSCELPVWEQTVEVELPDGMNIYWEGSGVSEPDSKVTGRNRLTSWALLNEPARVNSGLVNAVRPFLAFSLDRGQTAGLKSFRSLENPAYAPRAPQSVSSAKLSLSKTADSIAGYMLPRLIPLEDGTNTVRELGAIPEDGPWTAWEQTLIAGKWFSSLGFSASVYWAQKAPVGLGGPASLKIWSEPVLKAADSDGNEVYFKAGQSGDPDKLHPSLYGLNLYRAGNSGIEKITLPCGSASDNTLSQNWRVSVGEDGAASGTVNFTVTGGWLGVFGLRRGDSAEIAGENILKAMVFNIPGASFSARSIKPLQDGCKVSFSVNAVPGITSSGSLLLKLMGGVPAAFVGIPQDGSKYSVRFPFVFEIDSSISTPPGYKALTSPVKARAGDSGASLEQSLTHWPKRALVEGLCRWTVRSFLADGEGMSGRISEQMRQTVAWPDTAIPLRK